MPGPRQWPCADLARHGLSKTAEERYQTVAGVEADLRKCLAASESGARIDPFPLATQDVSDLLTASQIVA